MILKVCGVTDLKDALMLSDAGSDIIGFVFDARSPRRSSYSTLKDAAASGIKTAAVYTDPVSIMASEMVEDFVQIHFPHDRELIDYVHGQGRKVISVIKYGIDDFTAKYREYGPADIILVERKPKISEIMGAEEFRGKRIGFAGGIGTDDVERVIAEKPVMIDVSSSLESSPGHKDPEKVREFFSLVGGVHEPDR